MRLGHPFKDLGPRFKQRTGMRFQPRNLRSTVQIQSPLHRTVTRPAPPDLRSALWIKREPDQSPIVDRPINGHDEFPRIGTLHMILAIQLISTAGAHLLPLRYPAAAQLQSTVAPSPECTKISSPTLQSSINTPLHDVR